MAAHMRVTADPVWLQPYQSLVPARPATDDLFGAPLISDMLMASDVRTGAIPAAFSIHATAPVASPIAQLQSLSARYGVTPQSDLNQWQKAVAKAIIVDEARKQGIDPKLPLAVGTHESGLRMWTDVRQGNVSRNDNRRNGALASSDFGVMQVNDHAHAKAFPQVGADLEANIRYGVDLLARIERSNGQNLGLGLGEWDGVLAVYGMGHLPKTASEWEWAKKLVASYKPIVASLA